MDITQKEVEHVAKLARLELSEDEKGTFTRQLSAILTYMDQLKTLDTRGVEPTTTVLPTENVFRDDEVRPSLPQERALANAPEQADGFFRVPRILEDR
ncbi:MAG: Asp-tRNA(Asn)/Glu-tRNA(Gln) amidotransferase subunit GatC [Nitrospirota bacterium]